MIEVNNLHKTYKPKKGKPVEALKGINLSFEEQGLVFILGKSGSGKSTLLNLLGGLDNFDEGEIIIKGKSSSKFSQSDFDSYRNTFIGFIFQEYNILNDFTVGANIALAMELQGKKPTKQALNAILSEVDLEGYGNRKPNELSGGQKQRVAIARALIKNPEIIMADEPTGALDSNTGKQVFDTLKKLSKDKLVIVVSHDREFAEEYGDRVIELADGEVISDIKKYTAKAADVSDGIQVIEDKIIHIKSGYTLTENDLAMINNYLQKNKDADSFISIHGKTNEKIKRAIRINDEGNQEAFQDTSDENLNIKEYDPKNFHLIRSKLPLRNSLKIAAGSLKKKPFRLVMTILLSTVAFTLFALANTMSTYDKVQAGTDSIIDTNVDYVAFQKQVYEDYGDYGYHNPSKLSDDDIAHLQKQFPDMVFDKVYQSDLMDYIFTGHLFDTEKLKTNSDITYYMTFFSGIASITQESIDRMNFTLKGKLPMQDSEIMITERIAETFVKAGYRKDYTQTKAIELKSSDELINKTLTFGDKTYTIVGILDTNFDAERYEEYKEDLKRKETLSDHMLQSEMFEVHLYSYHGLLYTTASVFENAISSDIGTSINSSSAYFSFYDNEKDYNYLEIDKFIEYQALPSSDQHQIISPKPITELKEDEIILPISAFHLNEELYDALMSAKDFEALKSVVTEYQEEITSYPVMMEAYDWKNDDDYKSTKLKVVGVYASLQEIPMPIVIYNGFAEKYNFDTKAKYTALLSKMPESREEIEALVAFSLEESENKALYTLKNCTSYTFELLNSTLEELKKPFVYIGIFFAIFAAFMLMNFISISISYRKKEIGILRAVGARGADVFKIFFNESLMIAGINWLLSAGVSFAICSFTNHYLRTQWNMVVTILHFGIIQLVMILLISVAVAFVGSFLPVFGVSRKKPIEAIRKAD